MLTAAPTAMTAANVKRALSRHGTEMLLVSASRIAKRTTAFGNEDDLDITRNVRYAPSEQDAHLLDVYRLRGTDTPRPIVLYVHGGGFMMLSKETHWMFAHMFARAGYTVFSINYRLTPAHPFPAGLQDAAQALLWVKEHAHEYGGDPNRIVIAGESAGGNLTVALTAMTCFERPEPYAQALRDIELRAIVPMCGLLDTSRPERFWEPNQPTSIQRRILHVSAGYYADQNTNRVEHLASPLLLLESDEQPRKPLPPVFASCGLIDPILHDTERFERALRKRNVVHEVTYHPGEHHAFQAAYFRREAKRHWQACLGFLERHV